MTMKSKINGKVIFLDVDGVIATPAQIHKYAELHKHSCPPGKDQIDMSCVERLHLIVEATHANIVVSSTWRKLARDMFDLLSVFNDYSIPIIGMTDNIGSDRGEQIRRFMHEHQIDIQNVLVLDDDSYDLQSFSLRMVQTDGYYGLSDHDVATAIELLI